MGQELIVIIGGVAGGATAAARARRLSESAEITLVDREPYVSFANCGLPYFLSGDISKRSHFLLQTPVGFDGRYRVKVLAIVKPSKSTGTRGGLKSLGPAVRSGWTPIG